MPYIQNQGAKIYWDEQGSGEPLLLLMGLAYPSDMWYRTRPVLAKYYCTIAIDNRGIGRSDMPPGPYPIPLMASDALAVLDALGVESAHTYGISMGGMIAQELTLQHPKRIRSLILGCTAAGGPTAIQAEPEVRQMIMSRGAMAPEQAAEAAIPFIYDPGTARARIDEDLNIAGSVAEAARKLKERAVKVQNKPVPTDVISLVMPVPGELVLGLGRKLRKVRIEP